jgi:hypothetical protein
VYARGAFLLFLSENCMDSSSLWVQTSENKSAGCGSGAWRCRRRENPRRVWCVVGDGSSERTPVPIGIPRAPRWRSLCHRKQRSVTVFSEGGRYFIYQPPPYPSFFFTSLCRSNPWQRRTGIPRGGGRYFI